MFDFIPPEKTHKTPIKTILNNPQNHNPLILSSRKDLTLEDLQRLPRIFNWNILSERVKDEDGFSIDDVLKTPFSLPWNYEIIFASEKVDKNFLLRNFHLPWNWTVASLEYEKYDIYFILHTRNILLWDWNFVSGRHDLTIDLVLGNLVKDDGTGDITPVPWNFVDISMKDDLTFDIVKNNLFYPPNKRGHIIPIPWDWKAIHDIPSLKFTHVMENKHFPWNWKIITKRFFSRIINYDDWEFVKNNTHLPWDWKHLYSLKNSPTFVKRREVNELMKKYLVRDKITFLTENNICIICKRDLTTKYCELFCNHIYCVGCFREWVMKDKFCQYCKRIII